MMVAVGSFNFMENGTYEVLHTGRSKTSYVIAINKLHMKAQLMIPQDNTT